jgi:5,10-methenyltetrahydromethanopterin hydrogenase
VNGYVAAGYASTTVVLALYALRVVLRGRALRRALPPQEHRR